MRRKYGCLAPAGYGAVKRALAGVLVLCLWASACGYHTAGRVNTLPNSIQTLSVPAFVNQTHTFRIEQMLTQAVVREFVTRTRYKIISGGENADATLRGTVLSASTSPATYDSQTGRVATVLVTVNIKVSLTTRDGKVLFEDPSYVFRDQYQVSRELSSFFEEDTPAMERVSRDFARTLVSNVLEGF
jgi:outer membrane lipopolysaccharide assembly protein LptE/RlpB